MKLFLFDEKTYSPREEYVTLVDIHDRPVPFSKAGFERLAQLAYPESPVAEMAIRVRTRDGRIKTLPLKTLDLFESWTGTKQINV